MSGSTELLHGRDRRRTAAAAVAAVLVATSVVTLGAVAAPPARSAAAAPPALAPSLSTAAAPAATRAIAFRRGVPTLPVQVDRAVAPRREPRAPRPDPVAAASSWGGRNGSDVWIAPGIVARRVRANGDGTGTVVLVGPATLLVEGSYVITGPGTWVIDATGGSGRVGGLDVRDDDVSGRLRRGTSGAVSSDVVVSLPRHEELVPRWKQRARVAIEHVEGRLTGSVRLTTERGSNRISLRGDLDASGQYRLRGDGQVVLASRTVPLSGEYVSDASAKGRWLIGGDGPSGKLIDGTRLLSATIFMSNLQRGVTGRVAVDHGIDDATKLSLDIAFVDDANWKLTNPRSSATRWTPRSLPMARVDLSRIAGAITAVDGVVDYSINAPTSLAVDRLSIASSWRPVGPSSWRLRADTATGPIQDPSLGLQAYDGSGEVTASKSGVSGTLKVQGSGELAPELPDAFVPSTTMKLSFSSSSPDQPVRIARELVHRVKGERTNVRFVAQVSPGSPFQLQAIGHLAIGDGRVPVNGSYQSVGYDDGNGPRTVAFWEVEADLDSADKGRVRLDSGASLVTGSLSASSTSLARARTASVASPQSDLPQYDVPELEPGFEGSVSFKFSDNDPFTKTAFVQYEDEDNWNLTATVVDGPAWTPSALPGLTIQRNDITGVAYSVDGDVTWNITIPAVTWDSADTDIRLTTPMSLSNECPLESNCPGTEGVYAGFVGGELDFPGDIPDMQTTGAFLADGSWARFDATLESYEFGPVTLTDITLSIWLGARSDEPVPDLGMPDLSGANGGLNIQFCGGFEVEIPDIDTVGTDGCVAWSKAGIVIGQLAIGGSVDSAPANGIDIGGTTLDGFAWTDLTTMPTIDLGGIAVALEEELNTITADLSLPGDLMRALGQPGIDTVIPASGWFSDRDFSLDGEVPINMTNNGFTLESATVHIGKDGGTFTLELGANAKVRAKGNEYPVSAFIGVEAGGGSNGIVVRLTAKGAVSAEPDGTFDEPQLLPEGNFEPADDTAIDGTFDSRAKSTLAHGDFENADLPVDGVPNGDFENGTGGNLLPQGDFEDGAYGNILANSDFEDTDMLLNGDFEAGSTTSWTTTSNWTSSVISGTAPSEDEGYYVAQLVNSKGTASSTVFGFTQYVTLNPTLANATYKLTFWAKSPDTTTGALDVRINQDQTASGCSSQTAVTMTAPITVDSTWRQYTVTAQGVACRSRLGAAITVTTPGDSVLIDSVQLTASKGSATSNPIIPNTYRPTVSTSKVTQTVVLDPTNAHGGNQYLVARSSSSNWTTYWRTEEEPEQGEIYTFSAWVRSPTGSVSGKLIISTEGGTYEEVKLPFTTSSTWQRVATTLTIKNANHTDLLVKIGEVSTTNVDLNIDDVVVQRVDWSLLPVDLASGNVGVVSQSVIVDEDEAYEGTNYLEIVNKNSAQVDGSATVSVYQDVAGTPAVGSVYTLTGWFRSPNFATGSLWLRGFGLTPSDRRARDLYLDDEWQKLSISWTVPGGIWFGTRIEIQNETANGILHVDDVELSITPYAIPQSTATAWEPSVTFDTLPQISKSSDVVLDTEVGDTQGTLRSDGMSSQWYFAPGSVGDVTGDFDVSIDVFMPTSSGRDIANFAFWMTDTTGTPDGYMFRLQNSSTDSGFFSVVNNNHIGLAYKNSPILQNVWYRLRLTAVGSVVTAVVTRLDTGAVAFSQTATMPSGDRSGVFGQKGDGSQTSAGHRWDNFVNYGVTSFVYEDPNNAHAGRGYLRMTPSKVPATVSRATSTVPMAGSTYQATAWVKSLSGAQVSGTLSASTDGTFEIAKTNFTADSTWRQVQVTLPVTKTGGTAIRVGVTSNTVNVALKVDDVSVKLIGLSQPDPWFTVTSGSSKGSAVVWSDPDVAHGGSKYLEATISGATGSVVNDSEATVDVGDQYTMSAWVRTKSGTASGKMVLSFRGGSTVQSRDVSFTANTSWKQLVVTLPATVAGNNTVRAEFSISTLGVPVQIDDVSVDEISNWFVNTVSGVTTTEQVITDRQSAQGGTSFARVSTSGANGGITASAPTTIRAGAEYTMQAFVRSTSGSPVSGTMRLSGTGTSTEQASTPFRATSDWTDVSLSFTATKSNTTLTGDIVLAAAGALDVDSIVIKPTVIAFERPWLTTAGSGGTITAVAYDDPDRAHEGEGVLEVSKTGAADSTVYHDIAAAPAAGSRYTATAWVRSGSSATVAGRLVLTANGGTADTAYVDFTASDAWAPVTLMLPVTHSGHTSMTVSIVLRTAGVALLVDDVVVQDSRWSTFGSSITQQQVNDGEHAQSGSGFLRISKSAAGDAGVQLDTAGSVAQSTQQTMTAWVRSASGQPVTGRVQLTARGGTADDTATSPEFTATGEWQQVSVTVTVARSGQTSLRSKVFVDTVGEALDIDSISVGQEPLGDPDGIVEPLPHPERGYAYLWDDAFGIPGVHLWAFTAQIEYVNGSPGLGVGGTVYVDPTRLPSLMTGTAWVKGDLFTNISATQPCFSFGFDASGTGTKVQVKGGVFSTEKFEISIAPRGCTVGDYSLEPGAALSFETSLGDASFRLDLAIGRDDDNLPTFYSDIELRDLELAGTTYEVLQLTVDISAASQRVFFLGDFLMPMGRFRGSYDLTVSSSKLRMIGSVEVTDWQMVGGSFDVDRFSYTVDMNVTFGPGGCGGYTSDIGGEMSMGKKKYSFDGGMTIDCGVLKALQFRFDYTKGNRTYDFYIDYNSKTNAIAGGLGFAFERSTSWKFFGYRYRRHPKFSIRLDFYMDFDKPNDASLTLGGSVSVSGGSGSLSCTISGSGDDSCSLYVKIKILGGHTYRSTW